MNDFTKEELMQICDAILYSDLLKLRIDRLIPIRNKIQSMIDNYCEHDSYIDIGKAPMICKKCGEIN